ncbi:F-box protein At3g62230-like [Citrus sinensis]|uniref:F-box protein At3g62230-like n=1 Tax=Citrus clementina TaxID=85681 RepID=UPI0003D6FF9B|nr:F-box protein At3g62230-like [Citrus x clementina]XP_024950763.2 F-box protein At3g62230-like [Citrus sinensis]
MTTNTDPLSDFHDDLIIVIITFLPFIDAYRLCMSKKKWYDRSLWLHCRSFELHEASFMMPDSRQYWLSIGRRTQVMYMKRIGRLKYFHFVDRAVCRLASEFLTKFSFRLYYSSNIYRQNIDKWIEIVLEKSVQELSLDFSDGDPVVPQPTLRNPQYVLPHFFYEQGMCIRVLNINSCGLGLCNFVNFIQLTSLALTRVRLSWAAMENIAHNCPFLETLSLVECYRIFKVEITLRTLGLRKLIVRHCQSLSLGIELWLPRLQYFEYAGKMVPFDMRGMDDLEVVVLDYRLDTRYSYNGDDIESLFNPFSDARILQVSTSALKDFRPNYFPLSRGEIWTNNGSILDHLECVQFEGFTGKICEIDLVKFLLRNSRSIKELNIKQLIRATSSVTSEAFKEINQAVAASGGVVINWS